MSPSPGRVLRRLTCVLALGALLISAPVGAASAGVRSPAVPGARYVALGDSYSSGEGLFLYRRGTDTDANQCHRSPLAYGPLLSYAGPRYRPFSFVACSGAVTADLYLPNHSYPNEPAQLTALSRSTRTVTLTLGGNDIGFRAALTECIRPRGQWTRLCVDNQNLTGAVAIRTRALGGGSPVTGIVAMQTVLASIATAAPNATIYVGGYPELFGDDDTGYEVDPAVIGGRSCTLLDTGVPTADPIISVVDAHYLNAATRELNRVLADAVDRVRSGGVDARFVPATPFEGHGLCDTKRSWINPIVPSADPRVPRSESLHPNLRGSLGYASAFYAAWSGSPRIPAAVRQRAGVR